MHDYKSNDDMQLVAQHNAPQAGSTWVKPGKGWQYVKPSLLSRILAIFLKGI